MNEHFARSLFQSSVLAVTTTDRAVDSAQTHEVKEATPSCSQNSRLSR